MHYTVFPSVDEYLGDDGEESVEVDVADQVRRLHVAGHLGITKP